MTLDSIIYNNVIGGTECYVKKTDIVVDSIENVYIARYADVKHLQSKLYNVELYVSPTTGVHIISTGHTYRKSLDNLTGSANYEKVII